MATHLVAGVQVGPPSRYEGVVHVEDERREVFEAICGIVANILELGRHPEYLFYGFSWDTAQTLNLS